MVAIPVHQDAVPSVTWHLIIIMNQGSLFKKSRHALGFRCTLLFSQPHLCPGQPIPLLCLLKSPVFIPLEITSFLLTFNSCCLAELCVIAYGCWAPCVQDYIIFGPSWPAVDALAALVKFFSICAPSYSCSKSQTVVTAMLCKAIIQRTVQSHVDITPCLPLCQKNILVWTQFRVFYSASLNLHDVLCRKI